MKKKFIIVCGVIVLLIGATIVMLYSYNVRKVGDFNIAEYSEYITDFSSDKILGSIDNAEVAREKAESVWIELYGEEIKKERPYKVFYDNCNDVWLITGSLHEGLFNTEKGGIAYIIIQKTDGKVLAVWHDK